MRHLVHLTCFAMLVGALSVLANETKDAPVAARIGEATITLPSPDGYSDGSKRAPLLSQSMEKGTHPAKRFLALFAAETDLNLAATGGSPQYERYLVVQSLRQSDTVNMSRDQFDATKKYMRENIKQWVPLTKSTLESLANDVNKFVAAQTNGATQTIKVGETTTLGIFDESSNSVSFTTMTKYVVSTAGKDKELPMVISNTTALVKGKVIYLQVCSDFATPADVEWTQSATKAWLRTINSAN
jgi:hypothetical protein